MSTWRSKPPGEPSPSWSQSTREQRLDLLQAILAEYQKRADDLAEAVTEEIGAPPSLAAGPQVFLGIGAPDHGHRRAEELSVRGAPRADADRQGADRRLRFDHALELADQPSRGQGLPGVGDRLHRHPETIGGGPVFALHLRRDPGRRGRAGRGVQPRQRRRRGRGCGAGEPSRHRHGVVHRLHPRRCRGGQELPHRP